ncbi:methylated-DNA--[protein]-cysteine S-methyltransferase [Secundilactobacillus paracollinoides]|uniref:methylated-DNA--[protein]-cysteine S-methyltransferase n=1 Tax=Secundilactobacillus paracollinoides TaxID=240427 RepID=UPI0006D1106E|nr:methylated-DNA--[protein]-cysteine S-methyltransferase [Secundilactobacillus paracollinoides]
MTRYYQIQLPVNGQLTWLAGTATQLVFVGTPGNEQDMSNNLIPTVSFMTKKTPFFVAAAQKISRYLTGQSEIFDVPVLFLSGTPLQQRVWQALTTVPYGTQLTYSDLAQQVGYPKAVRAVATAVAKNPLLFVVPCHRVVRKDGSAGQYRGGVDLKRHLLTMEQQNR